MQAWREVEQRRAIERMHLRTPRQWLPPILSALSGRHEKASEIKWEYPAMATLARRRGGDFGLPNPPVKRSALCKQAAYLETS